MKRFGGGLHEDRGAFQQQKQARLEHNDGRGNDVNASAPVVANYAKNLGVQRVPAVVINGELADCCATGGPDEATLRAAGLGQPA